MTKKQSKTFTLIKSLIGRKEKHIRTANSLGLSKIGSTCHIELNDANLGKIKLINYLIK
jgi:ribosomal protein L30